MDPLHEPPADFTLELPLVECPASRWFRIHRRTHAALHFDRGASYRFNAPSAEFGVLYMSEKPEGAFAESLLGSRTRPLMVTQDQLQSRSVTAFDWRALVLADFCGLGLASLGLDARIASGDCYELGRRWAAWIHQHPRKVDGIHYPARNAPNAKSVALFDRAGSPSATTLLETSLLVRPGAPSPMARDLLEAFKVAVL